jgi:ferrous iron transport protein A
MSTVQRSVADLKVGETGVISGFKDEWMSLKLLEMGCLPGTEVKLSFQAPFGDPVCIRVDNYTLSLRRDEAATIVIR